MAEEKDNLPDGLPDNMLDSDKQHLKSIEASRDLREKLIAQIREIKRFHPENCTPTFFAELQRICINHVEQHIATVELNVRLQKLIRYMEKVYHGGIMADWPQELMDELSEGLGDEFKDL